MSQHTEQTGRILTASGRVKGSRTLIRHTDADLDRMAALRKELTDDEVGREFGISAQRVRQLLEESGHMATDNRPLRATPKEEPRWNFEGQDIEARD